MADLLTLKFINLKIHAIFVPSVSLGTLERQKNNNMITKSRYFLVKTVRVTALKPRKVNRP